MQGEIDAKIWRYGNAVCRIKRSPAAVMRYLATIGDAPGYQVVFQDPGAGRGYLRMTPAQFRALYGTGYLKEPVRLDTPEARRMASADRDRDELAPELLSTLRMTPHLRQPTPPHRPARTVERGVGTRRRPSAQKARPAHVNATGPLRATQRFRILKRDGYRCQLCGRSPREDGVKLHVDHKVARALGGTNDDENLWVLCDTCNYGKHTQSL